MKILGATFSLLKQTYHEWNEDNVPRLAAALAYYIAFALAPLLVITIGVVGFVLQDRPVREDVLLIVSDAVGQNAALFVDELINTIRQPTTGVVSTVLGVGALLVGALGAFEQLKDALNTVWNVPIEAKKSGISGFFINKLLSFGMILIVGFLLLISLALTTVLTGVEVFAASILPSSELLLRLVNFLISYGTVTLLFAMMYRYLPDIQLEWRDVWIGAFVTTLLFNLGKYLLGLYLVSSGTANAYGAAGSFVLILLWIYYSAQIVLFGAEFTQVYARRYGSLRDLPLPA